MNPKIPIRKVPVERHLLLARLGVKTHASWRSSAVAEDRSDSPMQLPAEEYNADDVDRRASVLVGSAFLAFGPSLTLRRVSPLPSPLVHSVSLGSCSIHRHPHGERTEGGILK